MWMFLVPINLSIHQCQPKKSLSSLFLTLLYCAASLKPLWSCIKRWCRKVGFYKDFVQPTWYKVLLSVHMYASYACICIYVQLT